MRPEDIAQQSGGLAVRDGRIEALDGFRGCAVLAIVLLHYVVHHLQVAPGSVEAYAQKYLMVLWIGVDAFFVLSGFLIGGILMDQKHAPGYFSVFYVRRALRILPPYIVLLIVWRAAQHMGEWPGMRWLLEPAFPMWPYLLYVQNAWMAAASSTGPNLVAATWSLAVEEQFYLLFPLLVRWLPARSLPAVLGVGILAAPILRCGLAFLGPDWQEAQWRLLPARWDSLLVGAMVAWIVRRQWLVGLLRLHRPKLDVLLVALCVLMALLPVLLNRPEPFVSAWRAFAVYLIVAAFFGLILLMLNLGALPRVAALLSGRVLCFFGSISYFVYLFHTAILGLAFALVLDKEPALERGIDWAVMAGAFALAVLLGWASWRWFEGPLVRFGHRFRYSAPAVQLRRATT